MDSFATSTSSARPTATPVSQLFHTRDDLKSNLTHQKRDRLSRQGNARPELKVISQPPGVNFNTLPGYFFEQTANVVTVFIMDFGINTDHSVSTLSKD
jgi:hypothetical protein